MYCGLQFRFWVWPVSYYWYRFIWVCIWSKRMLKSSEGRLTTVYVRFLKVIILAVTCRPRGVKLSVRCQRTGCGIQQRLLTSCWTAERLTALPLCRARIHLPQTSERSLINHAIRVFRQRICFSRELIFWLSSVSELVWDILPVLPVNIFKTSAYLLKSLKAKELTIVGFTCLSY